VSRVQLHQKAARWRIEGAPCLSQKPDEYIDSGSLFDIPEGAKFGIRFYWGGKSVEERRHGDGVLISVMAWCLEYDGRFNLCKQLMWRPQLVLINQVNEDKSYERCSFDEEHGQEAQKRNLVGKWDFYERSKLAKDGFMVDGVLVLELRVKAWVPKAQSHRLSIGTELSADTATAFIADWAALMKNPHGSDISLKAGIPNCDGTVAQPLRAHRLVLAARSPVFQQMFFGAADMAEAAPCAEVCLSDMEPPVAKLFLEFLYTGKVESETWADEDAVCHLLSAGHKYEVKSLVEACVARLVPGLCEENVAERLMMADLLGIQQIRDAALEFMCAFPVRLASVQSTEGFNRLSEQRPKLALQIMAKMVPPAPKRSAETHSLPADLSSKTVVQLKQLCSDRGLSTSGSKQALISRLQESS